MKTPSADSFEALDPAGVVAKEGAAQSLRADLASREPDRARVLRAAVGSALSSRAVESLSASAIGCVVLLSRMLVEREDLYGSQPWVDKDDVAAFLSMRGVQAGQEMELTLRALAISGLIKLEDGRVTVPAVTQSAQEEMASFLNRKAGWAKRSKRLPVDRSRSPVAHTDAAMGEVSAAEPVGESVGSVEAAASSGASSGNASQSAESPAPTVGSVGGKEPPIQLDIMGGSNAEPLSGPGPARKVAQQSVVDGVTYRRFTRDDKKATDPEMDPVVVRIHCDGDRVAEITRDYVDEMAQVFRSVDVESQLRLAASWCQSNPARRKTFGGLRRFLNTWMSNASREAEVRKAIVKASGARNGFGQGGAYSEANSEGAQGNESIATPQGQQADQIDEFEDLVAHGSSEPREEGGADTNHGAAGPVASARAMRRRIPTRPQLTAQALPSA